MILRKVYLYKSSKTLFDVNFVLLLNDFILERFSMFTLL